MQLVEMAYHYEDNELTDTGCRKIKVFQIGGLVGKNLENLEKIK
jgi:hypothetical protein